MESSLESVSDVTPRRAWIPQRYRIWVGIVLLLLVTGTIFWWNRRSEQHQAAPGTEPAERAVAGAVSVEIASLSPTVAPRWLEATGTVQPEMEAAVAAKVMGRVQQVLAREGDTVRRGQPLVVLDARDLDAAIAQANSNLRAASVGEGNARIAARMEDAMSQARIANAEAALAHSEAALKAATAKLELVQAGPRRQERTQAALSVTQAQAALMLAESDFKRMDALYREGAISAQQHDQFRTRFHVAKTQVETAQQTQSIADEGSRAEEIRAAQEGVRQAEAAVAQARAGRKQAKANALQVEVRRQDIQGAKAQIGQSQAALQIARVTRDYAIINSPFDGVVTARLVDPGAMASPGVPLLKVQGQQLRLEAVVPESLLVRVKKGNRIPVQLDALGNRKVAGQVVEIAPRGDAASHTFVVKIALPRESGASAGMFGRALFATGSDKRLLVPVSAMTEREGLHYLYVVDESDVARLRMVTVGDVVGTQIPILSGVNPGERIVVEGRERVADGAKVAAERR